MDKNPIPSLIAITIITVWPLSFVAYYRPLGFIGIVALMAIIFFFPVIVDGLWDMLRKLRGRS